MNSYKLANSRMAFSTPYSYALALLAVLICYIVMQIGSLQSVVVHLDLKDNDDMIRLLSVRSLLAGQSWFDMTQYKLMPPEGLALHWSRYVDAPIAGLQFIFRLFFSPKVAEGLSVLVWPSLLFFLFITLAARAMAQTYSLQAASFTVLSVIATGVLPLNYFHVGRIDHHNVQMTLMMGSLVLILRDQKPTRSGLLTGFLAALSAAVGLESLPFYLVIFSVLLAFAVLGLENSREHLLGFGTGLGLSAPILFAGQTNIDNWAHIHCDALSLPILLMTTSALVFSIGIYVVLTIVEHTFSRVLLTLTMISVFLFLLLPHLEICIHGPYSNLPSELRLLISNSISEALPVTAKPLYVVSFLFPPVVSIVAAIFALNTSASENYTVSQRKGAWLLVLLLSAMTIGLFFQVRFVVAVLVIMPLVFGFSISSLLKAHYSASNVTRRSVLTLLFSGVFFTMPLAAATGTLFDDNWNLKNIRYGANDSPDTIQGEEKGLFEGSCRKSIVLEGLNELPPGRILSGINLGPAIALHTHHFALSAPYHRNASAIDNGLRVVFLSEEDFLDAIKSENIDYFVICQKSNYGSEAILNKLALGTTRSWAEPIQVGKYPLVVFRLDLSKK